MGKAVLLVVGIVLFVYAVFDLIATPKAQVKLLPKLLWLLILVVPFVGPLLWMFWGHVRAAPPKPRSSGWSPPPGPRGPDDDPDYLRDL
ncbi:MAG: hypothetical protein JWP31_950 [Aeromicrobium sp.]|nr:hypothetical protein [Aeromicrobium sp.]